MATQVPPARPTQVPVRDGRRDQANVNPAPTQPRPPAPRSPPPPPQKK